MTEPDENTIPNQDFLVEYVTSSKLYSKLKIFFDELTSKYNQARDFILDLQDRVDDNESRLNAGELKLIELEQRIEILEGYHA